MKSTLIGAILVAMFAATAAAQQPSKQPPPPAPTPTPQPQPKPTEPVKPEPEEAKEDEGNDIDSLRLEYLKLRDELYQSRARAAAVASALYSTKITIKLSYGTGRFYTVGRATIRLDGASVYDDTEGAIAGDDAVRFEGWIAPGRHVVSIRVEAAGKDDERFTSSTEASFVVQAVGGKDLTVVAKAKDGGDIPYEWKRGEHGTYKLSIDADVRTVARPGEKAEKKAKAVKPTATKKKEKRRVAKRK